MNSAQSPTEPHYQRRISTYSSPPAPTQHQHPLPSRVLNRNKKSTAQTSARNRCCGVSLVLTPLSISKTLRRFVCRSAHESTTESSKAVQAT
ncbi:hypothetical protein N431DRAFT_58251 [Stipitochalara longipes BDJ]|nr:hypothetical protein N431DRAFT_58251 [Stipitochalara longipes BDJ]